MDDMSLHDYADQKGYRPRRPVSLADWMDDHPEIAAEVMEAWDSARLPASVIAEWLQARHGYSVSEDTVSRWCRKQG